MFILSLLNSNFLPAIAKCIMKNVILDLFLATETATRTIELPMTVTISKNARNANCSS